MAEPAEIAAPLDALLAPASLAGRRVLVTAGGTREPLDAARFIGNRSSGRMGVALAAEARAARRRGRAARREPRRRAAGRGRDGLDPDRARRCSRPRSRSSASTSRCSRPPSPTTGPRDAARRASARRSGEPWTLELTPTADIAARARRAQARTASCSSLFGADLGARGARAQARDARGQERRSRRLQRRLARRHRLRGRATTRSCSSRAAASGRSPRRPSPRSPPRSSTRSSGSARGERRLRPLPGGPQPPAQRDERAGDGAARAGQAARAGARRRSARRSGSPTSGSGASPRPRPSSGR